MDVETDTILQVACIITDGSLQQVVEGEEITVHHDEEVLARMNAWCVENHGRSGLTQAVRDSDVSMAEAEQRVLAFVQRHVPDPACAQIAGNSVHVDVAFLRKWMPRVVEYLHYRIVDVSTVGEREAAHSCWVHVRAAKHSARLHSCRSLYVVLCMSKRTCAHALLALQFALSVSGRPPIPAVSGADWVCAVVISSCCSLSALVPSRVRQVPSQAADAHRDERHPGVDRPAAVLPQGGVQAVEVAAAVKRSKAIEGFHWVVVLQR